MLAYSFLLFVSIILSVVALLNSVLANKNIAESPKITQILTMTTLNAVSSAIYAALLFAVLGLTIWLTF